MLKYSQKDMDAAIARVRGEVRPAQCFESRQMTENPSWGFFIQSQTATIDPLDVSVGFQTIPGAV